MPARAKGSAKALAMRLSHFRRRVSEGRYLDWEQGTARSRYWKVCQVKGSVGDTSVTSDTDPHTQQQRTGSLFTAMAGNSGTRFTSVTKGLFEDQDMEAVEQ